MHSHRYGRQRDGAALRAAQCGQTPRGFDTPRGQSPMDSVHLLKRSDAVSLPRPARCPGPMPELRSAFFSWLGPPPAVRGSAGVRRARMRLRQLCNPLSYNGYYCCWSLGRAGLNSRHRGFVACVARLCDRSARCTLLRLLDGACACRAPRSPPTPAPSHRAHILVGGFGFNPQCAHASAHSTCCSCCFSIAFATYGGARFSRSRQGARDGAAGCAADTYSQRCPNPRLLAHKTIAITIEPREHAMLAVPRPRAGLPPQLCDPCAALSVPHGLYAASVRHGCLV